MKPIKRLWEYFLAGQPPQIEFSDREKRISEGMFRIGAAMMFQFMYGLETDKGKGLFPEEEVMKIYTEIGAELDKMSPNWASASLTDVVLKQGENVQ